jgi:hypothetical protein
MKTNQRKTEFFSFRPPEPMQLLRSIQGIFPQFGEEEDVVEDVRDAGDIGLHCVMGHFVDFFVENHSQFTDRQLASLGELLNEAVAVNDNLENAVATCMLEHLRQINGYKALSPYLSQTAKDKTKP